MTNLISFNPNPTQNHQTLGEALVSVSLPCELPLIVIADQIGHHEGKAMVAIITAHPEAYSYEGFAASKGNFELILDFIRTPSQFGSRVRNAIVSSVRSDLPVRNFRILKNISISEIAK